ncbi:MAG TPA: hypothetical protein VGP24_13805 [Glaciihabitans sp.]|jgi:hypothetical protein|nr:hypothetical protein [Glaciihabitans sp.]
MATETVNTGVRQGALRVAGGVGVVLLAQEIVQTLTYVFSTLTMQPGFTSFETLRFTLVSFVWALFFYIVPLIVGVFVAMRWIVPIDVSLTVAAVLVRSVIAGALGSGVLFMVSLLANFFRNGPVFNGALFGGSFPDMRVGGADIVNFFGNAMGQSLIALTFVIPLVALAAILQWVWLDRLRRRE